MGVWSTVLSVRATNSSPSFVSLPNACVPFLRGFDSSSPSPFRANSIETLERNRAYVVPMKNSFRLLSQLIPTFGRSSRATGNRRISSRPLPYFASRRTSRMAASEAAAVGAGADAGAVEAAPVVGAADVEAAPVVCAAADGADVEAAPVVCAAADVADVEAAPVVCPAADVAVVEAAPVVGAAEAPEAAVVVGGDAADAAAVGGDDGGDAAAGGGGQRREGEWFRVSDSVMLALHRGSITEWLVDGRTDAIVNAANSRMLGGGGVDGAIHRKAGPKLLDACRRVPEVTRGIRCPVGEARITWGFDLPASRVIHTVGPIYNLADDVTAAALLGNAYRNSLKAAITNDIKYIAFPAISCGIYGYPAAKAAKVSLSVIREASNGLSEVHFVLFENETYSRWMKEASNQFDHI